MVHRLTGIGFAVMWLGSMVWLVSHDFWPAWTAQDVPQVTPVHLNTPTLKPSQIGIFNSRGGRIGTIWSEYSGDASLMTRSDLVHLVDLPFMGSLLLDLESDFNASGELQRLSLRCFGAPSPVLLDVERFESQMAVVLRAGDYDEAFELSSHSARMIGDVFRPFAALPDLEVGQTWRMQVFNPLSVILNSGNSFVPVIVKVRERTTIERDNRSIDVFVVEAPNIQAYVEPNGTVVEQIVDIPLIGRATVREEELDVELRSMALALHPSRHEPRWKMLKERTR